MRSCKTNCHFCSAEEKHVICSGFTKCLHQHLLTSFQRWYNLFLVFSYTYSHLYKFHLLLHDEEQPQKKRRKCAFTKVLIFSVTFWRKLSKLFLCWFLKSLLNNLNQGYSISACSELHNLKCPYQYTHPLSRSSWGITSLNFEAANAGSFSFFSYCFNDMACIWHTQHMLICTLLSR